MTNLATRIRHGQLRDALRSIRSCWASLASGNVSAAIEYRDAATRTLAFTRGLFVAHGVNVTATCRLERSLIELGIAVGEAVAVSLRGPDAEASDLVPGLLESLQVLQRKGVDVSDELLLDRARNGAVSLCSEYRFEALKL